MEAFLKEEVDQGKVKEAKKKLAMNLVLVTKADHIQRVKNFHLSPLIFLSNHL